jgi:hypothetical protein
MENLPRKKTAAELLNIGDALKELELKKLDLANETKPLLADFQEIRYKLITAVENTGDVRSRDLYADEDRKNIEIEHRLRMDAKAIELRKKLTQLQYEIEKAEIEIDHLENRQEVLKEVFDFPLIEEPDGLKEDENK